MSNNKLELAAEKYKNQKGIIPTTELEDAIFERGFIDGATSKYVEAEKLRFAIEQLKSLGQIHDESVMSERARNKIKELEQQLKSIENE